MTQVSDRSRRMFRNYPDVLTRRQAGELLGVCERTISLRIQSGELQAIQNQRGGKYLIPKTSVMRFLGIR